MKLLHNWPAAQPPTCSLLLDGAEWAGGGWGGGGGGSLHCLLTLGTCKKVLDTWIPSSERKKRPNLGVREIKISQIVYFRLVNSESYGYLTSMFSCNVKYILLSSVSFTERERRFLFPKNHALLLSNPHFNDRGPCYQATHSSLINLECKLGRNVSSAGKAQEMPLNETPELGSCA